MQMRAVPQEPRYAPHTHSPEMELMVLHMFSVYSVANVSTSTVTMCFITLFLLNTQVLLRHHTDEPIIFECANHMISLS